MYFVKIPGEKMAKYDLKYAWNCLKIFWIYGKSISTISGKSISNINYLESLKNRKPVLPRSNWPAPNTCAREKRRPFTIYLLI